MGSVLCVEWSENVENALPENTVRVYMEKAVPIMIVLLE